jgi:hypothetical protein
MIAERWVCLGFLILVAGCGSTSPPAAPAPPPTAGAQTPAPVSSSPAVVEGESLEAAVLVPAGNEADGIAFENEWIYSRYGRFRRRFGGLASLAGRRYDVVKVELSDHSERTLYFDVTDFFGREKPKPQ